MGIFSEMHEVNQYGITPIKIKTHKHDLMKVCVTFTGEETVEKTDILFIYTQPFTFF